MRNHSYQRFNDTEDVHLLYRYNAFGQDWL